METQDNQIRKLREKFGMSRAEFSKQTNIPVRTLEQWENGKRQPPEYLPRLLAYSLMYAKMTNKKISEGIEISGLEEINIEKENEQKEE